MKFTWGHAAIAMPVIIVIVFTTALIRSFSDEHKTELVTENYYEKEIHFQEQIDHSKNASFLNSKLVWKKVDDFWIIGVSGDFNSSEITGTINFFRPSDENLDFLVPISLDTFGEQKIAGDKFGIGRYQIQVEWTVNDTICYLEENIFIQ